MEVAITPTEETIIEEVDMVIEIEVITMVEAIEDQAAQEEMVEAMVIETVEDIREAMMEEETVVTEEMIIEVEIKEEDEAFNIIN